jgi:hypothetical protein
MRRILAAVAATSLLVSLAAPAEAGRRHRDRNDVDAGDVVAGALVIGAIAALASSDNGAKKDAAVDACSAEAESRTGGRISEIYGVSKRKGYYTVEGAVDAEYGSASSFTCTIRRGVLYSFRSEAR